MSKDAGQSRRLAVLAEIYDDAKRTDAARLGDVGLQVVGDWVLRFNAKGPAGLIDGKATGRPCKLNNAQRRALGSEGSRIDAVFYPQLFMVTSGFDRGSRDCPG